LRKNTERIPNDAKEIAFSFVFLQFFCLAFVHAATYFFARAIDIARPKGSIPGGLACVKQIDFSADLGNT
jgi:hypothetical protein